MCFVALLGDWVRSSRRRHSLVMGGGVRVSLSRSWVRPWVRWHLCLGTDHVGECEQFEDGSGAPSLEVCRC